MYLSRLVGRRIKETPKDAQLVSHQFLLRGGYMRQVASGIYSLLPLATRTIRKIEQIIREEMNGIDGEEVIMPVVSGLKLLTGYSLCPEKCGKNQGVMPSLAKRWRAFRIAKVRTCSLA